MSQVDMIDSIELHNCPPPKSSSHLSSVMDQPSLSKDNPIQLAAISNYKLAQLTFSPPDLHSMRKTALIKNMTDVIYCDTPPEWLDQMRRWQFFTPESLNDMTQDGLEQIFGQYIQTMEAFRPINLDDDDDDDELWADEEVLTPSDNQLELTDMSLSSTSTSVPVIMDTPLYSQSGASLSVDLLYSKEFKPLPERPTTTKNSSTSSSSTENNQRRKSLANMRNRLSWTSDTGLSANSAVAQTWANELMTMFNMEFQVDTSLTLSTAPKLPELPFSSRHNQHKRRSRKSQRYSTDSFMNLIPAFETFNLEELDRQRSSIGNRARNITFPPPPISSPPTDITTSRRRSASQPVPIDTLQQQSKPGPIRSSSLKCKSQFKSQDSSPSAKNKSTDILNGLVSALSGVKGEKALSKKKSIRRLAALVTGNTNNSSNTSCQDALRRSPSTAATTSPTTRNSLNRSSSTIYHSSLSPTSKSFQLENNSHLSVAGNTSRLSIASTSTLSSTNSVTMIATKTPLFQQHKPLPETPPIINEENITKRRTSYTMARPVVVEVSDLRRSRSMGYRPKKKRKSLKMTSSSKRRNANVNNTSSIAMSSSPSALASSSSSSSSSLLLLDSTNNQPRSIQQQLIDPAPSCLLSSPIGSSSSSIIPTDIASSASLNEQLLTCMTHDDPSSSSTYLSTVTPKRSKSAFMKLSTGLGKGQKKASSRKNSTSSYSTIEETNTTEANFVKRMASLGKRMKLQRV